MLVYRRLAADFLPYDFFAKLLHFARGVYYELRNVDGVAVFCVVERRDFLETFEGRFPDGIERVDVFIFFLRPFLEGRISECPAFFAHSGMEGIESVQFVEIFYRGD